ncbi:SOS response-associated peptidase [Segnochrobactrum spirostomi]|uniref:Abasic site processing protein n=1 Tax=Segnochrobactrum spirostomi TaxID=2608987 RepID=A0A6A7Y1K9_9HYPH|nr:SOS response-associated peptidase [Segnochrobactrum spirostomi]MQT12001.1 SOS response-associated peptidase [Segnochrobactrum spirostomi]
MCGRIIQYRGAKAYAELLGLDIEDAALPNAPARYNATPGQDLVAFRRHPESGRIVPSLLRWGLIPHWAKDPAIAWRLINARSETVARLPAFRSAFAAGRLCVVPVDGFYEWRREGKAKQPFAIARADRRPFALAGLWENWHEPDGEWRRTFTVLTCAANGMMAPLHDRMPVILADADVPRWLAGDGADRLMVPCADDVLEAWPVSPRVNSGREDDADLMAPVAA